MAEPKSDLRLEIAHVLFIDIIGYSKRLIDEQHELLQDLNQIIRNTAAFRSAETSGKLIRVPTGDRMALVFSTTPEAPVHCALEISKALRSHSELHVRMGIHSGPVSGVMDVNDRSNIAGAGINLAQRVMDCGDAGHILLSKRVAVPENRDQVLEMGMADSLIAKLSNIREIVVRSLNSVRKYSGLDQDPLAAGRELEVNSVLEGNVQKSSDRIRVSARLINVADGSSLWANTFDEKFTDVFAVQDAISQKVANALALRLSGEENKRVTRRYTENVEAYQLYLTGRYHWNKLTPPEITKSIGFFKKAIDLDPTYALAYFGLADAYRSLAPTSEVPSKDTRPQAQAAATKALELDETLAEPHATLAFIHTWYDWNWSGAEREAKRAIELNPNWSFGHIAYAQLLSVTGRSEEAIAEGARAVELDPLSLIINALNGYHLHLARRDDEAIARLKKTVELDSNFWIAHQFLGIAYIEKKRYPEAIAEFSQAVKLSGGNSEPLALNGYASVLSGDVAKGRAVLKELKSLESQRYLPPSNLALLSYVLGEKDEAFSWLEKAYQDRDIRLCRLKVDSKWDSMRSDPRFVEILKRIGLQ